MASNFSDRFKTSSSSMGYFGALNSLNSKTPINKSNTTITGISPSLQNNKSLSFTPESEDVKTLVMANGIYDRFDMDWYNKFTRFGVIDPYNTLTTTKEYVFITRPDLCILDPATQNLSKVLQNNVFFVDAVNRYKPLARQLQSSASPKESPFMTVLSNAITSTLDLPGISANSIETAANVMGTRINYRGTSYQSDQDFDFNLEFEDTKYLDVYMLFKMYDEYEKLKWQGAIDFVNAENERWRNYIIDKVLHDQVTMYKIVVGEDGYRIVYWARITGCYPTSIPRDAFSDMSNGTTQRLTVGWKGHFVRDMDPVILYHFNKLVSDKVKGKTELPLFNSSAHAVDGRWSSTPYIDIRTINDAKRGQIREYYLRWKL